MVKGVGICPAPARSPPPPSGRVGIPPPFCYVHCGKRADHPGLLVRGLWLPCEPAYPYVKHSHERHSSGGGLADGDIALLVTFDRVFQ